MASIPGRRPSPGSGSRLRRIAQVCAGAAILALLATGAVPARAVPPEGTAEPAHAAPLVPTQPPYEAPVPATHTPPYPESPWRIPAAAMDLLLVRPMMVTGLVGGAAFLVVTLPFTAPTRTTDDAARALYDQTRATFTRPLGVF
jgi:hypothetical protein